MNDWADKLKVVQREGKQVKLAIVSANNHYAGFGPATVSLFSQMMGLPRQEDNAWISQIKNRFLIICSLRHQGCGNCLFKKFGAMLKQLNIKVYEKLSLLPF
jgi:hypothetical protein